MAVAHEEYDASNRDHSHSAHGGRGLKVPISEEARPECQPERDANRRDALKPDVRADSTADRVERAANGEGKGGGRG